MESRDGREGWTVLIVRLPSQPSRYRVAVWRESRRVGAVQLGQASWALPDAAPFDGFVDKVITLVGQKEGEVLALAAVGIDAVTRERIRGIYKRGPRSAEWNEFPSAASASPN
jgi:hypothetical protein